jgi:repressor LexA
MSERKFNEIFSERLRYYLNKYNMTQLELSKRLGVGTTSVYNWCNGIKTPRMDKVDAMCKIFNCKRSDLIEDVNSTKFAQSHGVKISVLGRVAAGIPIEAIEDIIDTEEIPEELARTGTFFGLKIHGDSMEPKFSEGDVVIVRQQEDAESGDIVIATVNGSDATCKRLRKYRDGIELISTNPSYEPMFFSNQEIEEKPVKIIGRVVELRAKF